MGLNYPRTSSFTQSMRHRLDAQPTARFIVVEGKSDKQALAPFLNPDMLIVAANGKSNVTGAYDELSASRKKRLIFVVDCDGEDKSKYLGHPDMIFTDQRDIESDTLEYGGSGLEVARDLFIPKADDLRSATSSAQKVLRYSLILSTLVGTLLDSARSLDRKIRIPNSVTNTEQRIRVTDLADAAAWMAGLTMPTERDLACALGNALKWPDGSVDLVLDHATFRSRKLCRLHENARCTSCSIRNFANGHETVSIVSAVLRKLTGEFCSPSSFSRDLRLASRANLARNWPLITRIRQHGNAIGADLLLQEGRP